MVNIDIQCSISNSIYGRLHSIPLGVITCHTNRIPIKYLSSPLPFLTFRYAISAVIEEYESFILTIFKIIKLTNQVVKDFQIFLMI